MKQGFWKKIKKPFFVLAPMLDVTDAAFRKIIASCAKPDVIWTEFVSADGLASEAGRDKLKYLLLFSEKERPIVAQIFGSSPEKFEKAANIIRKMGFDGIDINMGCPERKVVKTGAGAALCNNPKLAQEIILATMRGAGPLPVSVKIRTGDDKEVLQEWLDKILTARPAAVTIHFRTRKEMSLVPARWDLAPLAVSLANKHAQRGQRTLVIGNGDVLDLADAQAKAEQYGVDGVMIGRGIFGNPWLFDKKGKIVSNQEKMKVLLRHIRLYDKIFSGERSFNIMKKHFKAYVNGFDGAKELRIKLMEAQDAKTAEAVLKYELKNNVIKCHA